MYRVQAPHRLWAREEYYRMAEVGLLAPDERVELIGGEIIAMTPQDSRHATAVLLVEEALRHAFGAGYTVRVQLPLDLGRYSQPAPNVAVVRGSPRDYRDAHPTTAVLVVEVAGASLAYDRHDKAGLYASAGIEEYWIVNLLEGCLEVFRQPVALPARPFGHGYGQQRRCGPADSVAPLAAPHALLRVADLLP